jgi:hypothetical protein
MAHDYRPGMKMYQVVWERDGNRVATRALHAADEADARSRAIWLGDRVSRSYDDLVTVVATTRGRRPEHRQERRYD